ncbi:PREDICTED: uncharacterized protein LOC105958653 [Erythranthe guttata]|uniref:uncharacterized protein LOC105958653 n=1 Tax=Erythranthe guttata TaxID=4155 RepID=UPI00064DC377|nr:PREDICTED: uncharacterized protein LOC105958653 [Erythranthe guttata]|eukprot:XP_012838122.1 PREDICTED: uncharacterized protein LOC105958653 [Erythranthe guttata]
MNFSLGAIPGEEEMLKPIKTLSPDTAQGQDGFTGYFYVHCWDIIRIVFMEMLTRYFLGDYLSRGMTITLLFLLSKVENPEKLNQFRPISLENFGSNLISRIIPTRMSEILLTIASEEQTCFIKKRRILVSIAIAQELVSDIDRKVKGGNVIFKFDMSKAYDRLEGRFLITTMQVLGFSHQVFD